MNAFAGVSEPAAANWKPCVVRVGKTFVTNSPQCKQEFNAWDCTPEGRRRRMGGICSMELYPPKSIAAFDGMRSDIELCGICLHLDYYM